MVRTMIFGIIAAMSLPISLILNCLDFLINQTSHFKNGLQPQLIGFDASVDYDTSN